MIAFNADDPWTMVCGRCGAEQAFYAQDPVEFEYVARTEGWALAPIFLRSSRNRDVCARCTAELLARSGLAA